MGTPKQRKKKLNVLQTRTLLPILKKFNETAKGLISSMAKKIEYEEKNLAKISVMVQGMKLPQKTAGHQVNIQTIDMGKTKVKTKGSSSFNQVMEWEKHQRRRSKGTIL